MAKFEPVDPNTDIRIMNRAMRKGSITHAEYQARLTGLDDVSDKLDSIEAAPLMEGAKEATARRRAKALTEEPAAAHRIPVPAATYEDEAYGFPARGEGEEG